MQIAINGKNNILCFICICHKEDAKKSQKLREHFFANSSANHQVKTKQIMIVKEVWIPGIH